MKIESISYKIPSLEITNDQILAYLEKLNPELTRKTLAYYKRVVKKVLTTNGCEKRYFRDKGRKETAIQLTLESLNEALFEAGINKEEIDLLIFCGVGRGFLEPAYSYFIANSANIKCDCIDILDACMSWVKSLEIAEMYLKRGKYSKVAIINAEFNAYERGFPELYQLHSQEDLKSTLSSFTIGEAATTTIVSKSDNEWKFVFDSYPEYASLCSIPIKGFKSFIPASTPLSFNGINKFSALGHQMMKVARQKMIPLIQRSIQDVDTVSVWFPHLASLKTTYEISDALKIDRDKLQVESFKRYGNIVSATIPTSIKIALENKILKKGQKVVLCPGSAGMSFGTVEFIYH